MGKYTDLCTDKRTKERMEKATNTLNHSSSTIGWVGVKICPDKKIKKFGHKTNLSPEKNKVPYKIWVLKKVLVPKNNLGPKQNLGPEKNLGPKNYLCPEQNSCPELNLAISNICDG